MLTTVEPEEILNAWEIYCSPRYNFAEDEAADAVAEDYEIEPDYVIEILSHFGIDIKRE